MHTGLAPLQLLPPTSLEAPTRREISLCVCEQVVCCNLGAGAEDAHHWRVSICEFEIALLIIFDASFLP